MVVGLFGRAEHMAYEPVGMQDEDIMMSGKPVPWL
jgi:hypothetical protein